MKTLLSIPLVNWGMGAIIIGVFAIVCFIMAAIVYSMVNTDKKQQDSNSSRAE
ncbi:hypothetical protein ACFQ1Q_12050 [Winogradskyella litorisediminis]|uniref:DUF3149 domain-containing protein n=1 Tax=Winogradskyella litorisediminis TaxID=1156618 RepID=A0ABW3NBV9_9FLAO